MDHIAGILRVGFPVLVCRLMPVPSCLNIHGVFPYYDQKAAIFQYCQTSHGPKKNCRQCYIFYKSYCSPDEDYFFMDLTISVNFFKPLVCSNNVPITKPSAPALMSEFAIFAALMPPPTMIKPSKTYLTVATISGVTLCFAPEPASR